MAPPRLAFLVLGAAILCAEGARALFINNGKSPPNAANVIASPVPAALIVRNSGCAELEEPCLIPREPTTVEVVSGGLVGAGGSVSGSDVRDSSQLQISGGRMGRSAFSPRGSVRAHDRASVMMTQGQIESSLQTFDYAHATLAGGFVRSVVEARDYSRILPPPRRCRGGRRRSRSSVKRGSSWYAGAGSEEEAWPRPNSS